jgi:antitoxin component of MazEF toxin-antitoxin module
MVGCLTKTRKVGGSIVVTLPKELVETQNIKENQYVEIMVKKCRKTALACSRACLHSPQKTR